MAKRFYVIIEDDWELMGNGSGNVASHQYLPALFLMKMARELDIKITFMVDVAQQLAFIKYQDSDANVRVQKELWDSTVCLMKESGFDVQLHLHPQWTDATYSDGHFTVGNNWNLGTYESVTQGKLIKDSIDYLQSLLRPIDPDYKVHSFKAGNWGLQPFKSLHTHLSDRGIKVVLGVRKGLKVPSTSTDYDHLEENTLPYHPDVEDICRLAESRNTITVLPLSYYSPNIINLSRLVANALKRRVSANLIEPSFPHTDTSASTGKSNSFNKERRLNITLSPYVTHLKIGSQPYSYLKASFDAVMKRLRRHEADRLPIVIESHTKLYLHNYKDIYKFLHYLTDEYGDEIEFSDLSSFLHEIENDKSLVRHRNET